MTRIDAISLNQTDAFSARAANMSPASLRRAQDRSGTLVAKYMNGEINSQQYMQGMQLHINEVMKAERFTDGESTYRRSNGLRETDPLPRSATADSGDPLRINQLAYSGQQLGNGGSTLSGAGCLLSATTMASNRLNGTAVSLPEANRAVRSANGAFAGSNMNMGLAANALDTTILSRNRVEPHSPAMDDAIARMQNRRPPTQLIVGVDYKAGGQNANGTDHFINVHSVSADGRKLHGVDSIEGRDVTFTRGGDGRWRAGHYTVSEVSVLASTRKLPAAVAVAPEA